MPRASGTEDLRVVNTRSEARGPRTPRRARRARERERRRGFRDAVARRRGTSRSASSSPRRAACGDATTRRSRPAAATRQERVQPAGVRRDPPQPRRTGIGSVPNADRAVLSADASMHRAARTAAGGRHGQPLLAKLLAPLLRLRLVRVVRQAELDESSNRPSRGRRDDREVTRSPQCRANASIPGAA